MTSQSFSRPGAVDLSHLAGPAPAGNGGAAGTRAPTGGTGAAGALVVDADEATFQAEVLERSLQVPVVVDFWASWCGPCRQLSPVLERLAGEYGGRFVLAKVDVDANPGLAQAVGAQSIPLVLGAVGGRVVPLFMGALPAAEVRRYIDELLKVAAQAGVTGTVAPSDGAADGAAAEAEDRYADADAATQRGDYAAAAAAYQKLLDEDPGDAGARQGLAGAHLLTRVAAVDERQALAAADARPDDVAAQTLAADVDLAADRVEQAFGRLVDTVRRAVGADRDAARKHLLDLFEVLGPDDPRVAATRRALARALY